MQLKQGCEVKVFGFSRLLKKNLILTSKNEKTLYFWSKLKGRGWMLPPPLQLTLKTDVHLAISKEYVCQPSHYEFINFCCYRCNQRKKKRVKLLLASLSDTALRVFNALFKIKIVCPSSLLSPSLLFDHCLCLLLSVAYFLSLTLCLLLSVS